MEGTLQGGEAVYGHRRGPEGLTRRKGRYTGKTSVRAIRRWKNRHTWATRQDPRRPPVRRPSEACGPAGRAPATRGGDPGQGGRARGVLTPRTDWRPPRYHWPTPRSPETRTGDT